MLIGITLGGNYYGQIFCVFLIFISGIAYIFIGVCSLYINGTILLGVISLIPLVILTLSSKINKAFGIKNNKS